MAAFVSASWTLPFWYAVAVAASLLVGIAALFEGSFEGLPMLLFGGISLNSFVAGIWFAWHDRSWDPVFAFLPLLLSVGYVAYSISPSGGTKPLSEKWVNPGEVAALHWKAFAAQFGVLGVPVWRLWPDWRTASALAAFSAAVFVVAFRLSSGALAHMYL